MKIKVLTQVINSVGTNCYFVVNEDTNEVILIDTADSPNQIISIIEENGYKPKAILLTHGHYDHILATEAIKSKYDIPVIAGEDERELLQNTSMNLSGAVGRPSVINADDYIKDGESLDIAGFTIKAIATPGHTAGGVCYYFNNEFLMSGDTLFEESVGRSDFPTGNMSLLVRSIKEKLFNLPDDTIVYPGHADATTIEHEKNYNPFCQ